MEQTKTIAFALLRYALFKEELPNSIRELITRERLERVYSLLKSHDLAHLVADVLDKNGLLDDSEVSKKFRAERNLAIYRHEQMQYELTQICDTLEKAQIPFIPLKGSVIRSFYPEPWMRTSCDIDILVDKAYLELAQQCLKRDLEYQLEDIESFPNNKRHHRFT